MDGHLTQALALLPDLHAEAQFTKSDFFAILQGIAGFFSGIVGKDPLSSIGAAVGVAEHYATRCNTGTLQENLDNLNKWLTFGQAYRALKDSSELDFDRLDVAAIPEIMQVTRLHRYID